MLSLGFNAVNYVGLWEWKTDNLFLNKLKKCEYNLFKEKEESNNESKSQKIHHHWNETIIN